MKSEPVIDTMIGAVNLYTGNLDIYKYKIEKNVKKFEQCGLPFIFALKISL